MHPTATSCVACSYHVLSSCHHNMGVLGSESKHWARRSGVRPITEQDRADIAAFPFSSGDELAQLGATAHVGEEGFGTLERQCGPGLRC